MKIRAGGESYIGGPGEESREEWRTHAETGRLVLPLRWVMIGRVFVDFILLVLISFIANRHMALIFSIRDWSLITGRGVKLFVPPPFKRVETFCAPPPSVWLKLQATA